MQTSSNALCKKDRKIFFLVGRKNLKLDFKPFSLGNKQSGAGTTRGTLLYVPVYSGIQAMF
jgi:hypothetical protein